MNITEEIYIVIPEYLLSSIVVLSKLINIININESINILHLCPSLTFFGNFYVINKVSCRFSEKTNENFRKYF